MDTNLINRTDLIKIFNQSRFRLRHFALGFYPTGTIQPIGLPVNRMFFPLRNPGRAANYVQDGKRRLEFRPGMLYFIPAYYPVRMVLDDRLEFLSVQCNLEIFPGTELFSGCSRFLEISAPSETNDLLEICKADQESFFCAVRAGAISQRILADILQYFRPDEFKHPMTLMRYSGLMDHLEKQANAQTSVSDLAALQGISREYFTRHFTQCTGLTPKQLIDRFVINRCIALIEEGKNFKEISAILHFSNEFVFSRYFKRNIGVSPRMWKTNQTST